MTLRKDQRDKLRATLDDASFPHFKGFAGDGWTDRLIDAQVAAMEKFIVELLCEPKGE